MLTQKVEGETMGKSSIKRLLFALLSVFLLQNTFADESFSQYVIWSGAPITIDLSINQKKSLIFEDSIVVGMSPELSNDLAIKNEAGVLYITAKKQFINKRIIVKNDRDAKSIILDLSVVAHADNSDLHIFYDEPDRPSDDNKLLNVPSALKGDMAYITLTRYAEHQLYAPKRLQENPYHIRFIKNYVSKDHGINESNRFDNLFLDESTINIPWGSWQGAGYFVTAVLIRNQLPISLDFSKNIGLICGRSDQLFKAVTFFPNWKIEKAGSSNDTTVAFFISSKPFDEIKSKCEALYD